MALLTTCPQCRVTFFSQKGTAVVSLNLADTTASDQLLSVQTHKDLGQPAGSWSVVMTAQEFSPQGGWKDLLRLGDLCVIEMGPDRPQPKRDSWYQQNWTQNLAGVEIVMIGSIDDIRFATAVGQDGRPQQHVTVSGRDFGKYLVDDMIWFDPWWNPTAAILKWNSVFVDFPKVGWAGTPGAVFDTILQKWIFSQFDVTFDVTTRGSVKKQGNRSLSQILRYVFDVGTPTIPYAQNLMSFEGSPWAMMQTVENRPWYMLTLDTRRAQDIALLASHMPQALDSEGRGQNHTTWNTDLGHFDTQVALLYHRCPFSNRFYDDWTELPTRIISDDDLLSLDVGKSLDDIFNRWQVLAEWPGLNRTLGADTAEKLAATNLEFRYGFRPRVLRNCFAFDSRDVSGNLITNQYTQLARDWDINNQDWLNGAATIKGMAQVKVGDRLHYVNKRQPGGDLDFYVESVSQEFSALSAWRTMLGLTRGQPHRSRGQKLFDANGNVIAPTTAMEKIKP
jgi:hypothetical protein